MKKVMLLILILIPLEVGASCKEITKYKFYKEEKIYSNNYNIENEQNINYPYKSNIKKETNYTEYSYDNPINKPNRTIETKLEYNLDNLEKIKYLKINSIVGEAPHFTLKEIKVYIDDQEINYDIYCYGCLELDKINNNIIFENYTTHIFKEAKFYIILNDYYNPLDIRIDIYHLAFNTRKLTISWSLLKDIEQENNYISYDMEIDPVNYYQSDRHIGVQSYQVKETDIKDYFFENSDIYNKLYRYKDLLYKYYYIKRIYLDGYYQNKTGYIKDVKLSKTEMICPLKNNIQQNVITKEIKNVHTDISFYKKVIFPSQSIKNRHIVISIIGVILVIMIITVGILIKDKED